MRTTPQPVSGHFHYTEDSPVEPVVYVMGAPRYSDLIDAGSWYLSRRLLCLPTTARLRLFAKRWRSSFWVSINCPLPSPVDNDAVPRRTSLWEVRKVACVKAPRHYLTEQNAVITNLPMAVMSRAVPEVAVEPRDNALDDVVPVPGLSPVAGLW